MQRSRGDRGVGESLAVRYSVAAETSCEVDEKDLLVCPGVWILATGRRHYAKLVRHERLDQPVPRQQDVSSGRDGLGELEEDAGGLGEALGREEDGVLELERERAKRAPPEQLVWRGQRVCHVRHAVGPLVYFVDSVSSEK